MEDCAALVQSLLRHENVPEAFEQHTQKRKGRTEYLVGMARKQGDSRVCEGAKAEQRDQALRCLSVEDIVKGFEAIFGAVRARAKHEHYCRDIMTNLDDLDM